MYSCSYKRLALSLSLGVLLIACNGNNDNSTNSTAVTTVKTISGTAAAGAPIVGQVTVKDAKGVLKTVNLDVNGKYNIDVTELTAPFVFRAQGKVGGRDVYLVSAATSSDINGTINITPFTDLMIANIAGQAAEKYFENPIFSKLTTDELNSARTVLTQRLLPALTSLGVASGFDLLRSAFSANHVGFDAVMDTVQVTVDSTTNKAIIKDLVNQKEIVDDLTSKTDNTLLPNPVIPLAGAITDLQAIDSQLKTFTALFAQSLPSEASLRKLFVSDGSFLGFGKDLDSEIQELITDSSMIGTVLSQPRITQRISDTEIRIEWQEKDATGSLWTDEMVFKKEGAVWKMKGNQDSVDQDIEAVNVRWLAGAFGSSASEKFERKLDLWVSYAPPLVSYIKISGAGLEKPILMQRQTGNWTGWGFVNTDNTVNQGTWLSECGEQSNLSPCINFSQVGENATYTFQPLDSNKQNVLTSYTKVLQRAPVASVDAEANADKWFASIQKVTPVDYRSLANGSNISISVIKPTDITYRFHELTYGSGGTVIDNVKLGSDGQTVNVTWSGTAPISRPFINLRVIGSYERNFVTMGNHNAVP